MTQQYIYWYKSEFKSNIAAVLGTFQPNTHKHTHREQSRAWGREKVCTKLSAFFTLKCVSYKGYLTRQGSSSLPLNRQRIPQAQSGDFFHSYLSRVSLVHSFVNSFSAHSKMALINFTFLTHFTHRLYIAGDDGQSQMHNLLDIASDNPLLLTQNNLPPFTGVLMVDASSAAQLSSWINNLLWDIRLHVSQDLRYKYKKKKSLTYLYCKATN